MSQIQPAEGQSSGGYPVPAGARVWPPAVARDVATALDMIASGRPLASVLTMLVRAVERHEPGVMASVMITSEDGRVLIHGAAPSLPEPVRRAYDGLEIGPEAG